MNELMKNDQFLSSFVFSPLSRFLSIVTMKILMRADTHVNIELPGNAPVAKCTFTQVLAALSVSLGSMVVGYASSYTSPGLVSMQNNATTRSRLLKKLVCGSDRSCL